MFVVVPTYTKNENLENLAIECVKSYKTEGVRIVVCEDGQMYSDKLRNLADFYIYNHENVGFTKNVNRGWKYAIANGADYVAVVNSDTTLKEGSLRDLCIPNMVTSPVINGGKQFWGCFWVCHKELSDSLGYLDERLVNYYSDTEYERRIGQRFKVVESVVVNHHGAESVREAGIIGKLESDKNIYENLR